MPFPFLIWANLFGSITKNTELENTVTPVIDSWVQTPHVMSYVTPHVILTYDVKL